MKYKHIVLLTVVFLSNLISLIAQNPISAKLSLNDPDIPEGFTSPQFFGGEKEFYNYLSNNIAYPHILIKTEMEGSIDLSFVINKEGKVQNIEITKGFDPLADDEVVRVLKAMPQWASARVNGEPTDSKHKLTVTFTLTKELIEQAKNNIISTKPKEENKEKQANKEEQNNLEKITETLAEKLIDVIIPTAADTLLNREPQYPGGKEALEAYLKKNMKYPKRAIEYKIEGRAVFSIVISAEGEITKIMIYKGLCRDCDEEAYYLIKKMPNWIPGLKDGKPVSMQIMLPIPFVLPK